MSPSSSPCAVTWSWFIKSHNHQSQIRSVFIPDYAILSSDLVISLFVILLSFYHPVVTKFASLFLIIACQKKTLTGNISLCNQFPVFICFLKHRIVSCLSEACFVFPPESTFLLPSDMSEPAYLLSCLTWHIVPSRRPHPQSISSFHLLLKESKGFMFVQDMLCISPKSHISAAMRYISACVFIVQVSHDTMPRSIYFNTYFVTV